jgi:signal transduction histidine kinase
MQEYRRKVQDALTQLETIVRGMEQFGSKPGSPVDECLRVVRSCKVYVGIFGMRYGSIPDGLEMSMTHLEYNEAQRIGLPSLIYLLDENQPIPAKDVEIGTGAEKLKTLKKHLAKSHIVSFYTTPEDLRARILHDVPALLVDLGTEVLPVPASGLASAEDPYWPSGPYRKPAQPPVSTGNRDSGWPDEFISTVSREMRTPLTALRAALGLIAGGALEKRPEKRAQMMDVAIGNCDRLVRVVNDILDFERMGAGRLPMQFQEVEAKELLRRATDLQHPSAQKAGIGFIVDAGPLTLWIDEDRILQTLGNLISNAIKFSPAGSEITLRAKVQSATEAIISVEDKGRGIPPEKLDIIFERFQQVDASDSRDMGGTGLGLAICRNIVRQHGGRIWAESVVGKGSTFFFTVPRTSTW